MSIRQGFMVAGGADVESAFGFAADRGFDFVELNMEEQFHRRRVDPTVVRETAARHDIDLLVHLPYRLDTGSPHEEARLGACRELEAAIDVAAELDAERATFHAATYTNPDDWEPETLREAKTATIDRVTAYARQRGVEAVVENLKSAALTVDDFPRLFETTGATACLDTGHAHVTGHDATAQADLFRDYGDRISHVHLNDTRHDEDDEHLPVGLGAVDFAPLATAMTETGWSGTCTHELWTFGEDGRRYAAHGKAAFDALL